MKAILVALSLFLMPLFLRAAEEPAKEAGLPTNAVALREHSFITNSMLVTWVVALVLIIFARVAGSNMKQVPDGAQNFWEWMVESLYNFLESIVGADLVKKTFWFFATIFIFIFFTNWFGLIPGVGTVGWGNSTPDGFRVTHPLLRGGNADLNMTFAMAAIFMVLWLFWAIQGNGIGGFFMHIFGPKGESSGAMKYLMILIFFAVGIIEVVSISFRPISLSFRLFGNIFAGENLLDGMSHVIEHPAWLKTLCGIIFPIPFYFMELLVGLVQALVFMLLTAVFTSVMCSHDDHGKEAAHH